MSESNTKHNTLVLFSGGKDSFVSACMCVDRGDRVGLISFNNGSLISEENFLHGATRLVNRYGSDTIHYEGVYPTVATLMVFRKRLFSKPLRELGEEFPRLPLTQVNCTLCQTAMWTAAIAYAIAKGYDTICTGYRNTDVFCTGSLRYLECITNVAMKHSLEIFLPMWAPPRGTSTWEYTRDSELCLRQFLPAVYEPKCSLGLPTERMATVAEEELCYLFTNYLEDTMLEEIEKCKQVFQTIPLTSVSFEAAENPIPNPATDGCY